MLLYALGDAGNDIIGETFYSEGGLRFGDYVARNSAAPISETALELRGSPAHMAEEDLGLAKDVLRELRAKRETTGTIEG
jgi:hypothetical protein